MILSLGGGSFAIPIVRLLEITVPRQIEADENLSERFEGKIEYRGKRIPVLNVKKVFNLGGSPGAALLVVKSDKGPVGMLVDEVKEILDTDQKPVPMPKGVVKPGLRYYGGVLRHKDGLVLLLNEDGLLS